MNTRLDVSAFLCLSFLVGVVASGFAQGTANDGASDGDAHGRTAGDVAALRLTRRIVADNPSARVSSFELRGEFKYSRRKAESLAGIAVGERLGDIDPDAVEQRFLALGFFSEARLDAELSGEDVALTLTLTEKATLVPAPIVSLKSARQTYGAAVMDADFLGSGHGVVLGALYSTDGSFTGIFGDGVKASSRGPGYNFMLAGKLGKVEVESVGGDAYRSYRAASVSASFAATVPLIPNLSAKSSISYAGSEPSADDEAHGSPGGASWISPGVALVLDAQRAEGFFRSGPKLEVGVRRGFGALGEGAYSSLAAAGSFGLGVLDRGALQLQGRGEVSDRPDSALEYLRGSRLLSGMNVQASSFAAAAASFEYAILRFRSVDLTLGGFYEAGLAREGVEGDRSLDPFRGPGLGIRAYLRAVAIPALGIDVGYESVSGALRVGAVLGMAF